MAGSNITTVHSMFEAPGSVAETVASVLGVATAEEYYITKSFSWDSSWRDVFYDFGIFLGSLLVGMVAYMLIVRFLCPQTYGIHLYMFETDV